MKLHEKIAVMQAAERGETIQVRDSVFDHIERGEGKAFYSYGREWSMSLSSAWFGEPMFNFSIYEYRVKPKSREVLIRVYGDGAISVQFPFDVDEASVGVAREDDILYTVFEDSKLLRFREVVE